MAEPHSRSIEVRRLARVEGEGSLHLEIRGGRVTEARFSIGEPPRFFEAFLRGRSYREVPDITARICGICPVAYQMSSVHALEMAFGVDVGEPVRRLRRLFYCGEWIASHVLHIFLLHLPDFMGYESAISMAADHRELVTKALQLKKAGNEVVSALGGREVHPVSACVGGFHRVPTRAELAPVAERLRANRPFAVDACKLLGSLDFPDFEMPYLSVALRHRSEVAMCEGSLATSRGLTVPVPSFLEHFEEIQVEHSNALHGGVRGGGSYLVGPLARLNLNWDLYPDPIKELAREIGFRPPCHNPFKSIIARGLETLYALDHAVEIIEGYERPEAPAVPITPREGEGHGCTEAPRGILYHRYRIDRSGLIEDAVICPPTAQNQRQIEADLAELAPKILDLDHDQMTLRCEQLIRSYDPCISCATHFLTLTVERGDP
jgi:coenzyme F420-reducing hydrogenase alpha subunit